MTSHRTPNLLCEGLPTPPQGLEWRPAVGGFGEVRRPRRAIPSRETSQRLLLGSLPLVVGQFEDRQRLAFLVGDVDGDLLADLE